MDSASLMLRIIRTNVAAIYGGILYFSPYIWAIVSFILTYLSGQNKRTKWVIYLKFSYWRESPLDGIDMGQRAKQYAHTPETLMLESPGIRLRKSVFCMAKIAKWIEEPRL